MKGHYFAYIKMQNGKWCKFDDENVTEVNGEEAMVIVIRVVVVMIILVTIVQWQ